MIKLIRKGIYCFIDKKNGIVDYIGRFSGRQRIYAHYNPSKYDEQPFNRILQNNQDRYEAKIICEYSDLTNDELNYLEIKEILKHKFLYSERPRFNYTIGGDGGIGYIPSEETRKKLSDSKKGKNNPMYRDDLDNDVLVYEYFNNGLSTIEIAKKYNCCDTTVRDRLNNEGFDLRERCSTNTSGYYRVTKDKCPHCGQGFIWAYQYYDDNGKLKKVRSVDIKKLEGKVRNKGLEWREL